MVSFKAGAGEKMESQLDGRARNETRDASVLPSPRAAVAPLVPYFHQSLLLKLDKS